MIRAGILCWNQDANNRVDLFDRCFASLESVKPVVADNGSTDGSTDRLRSLPKSVVFPRVAGFPHANTCGYGMSKLAATLVAKAKPSDIIILSNDDIEWSPDFAVRLKAVWKAADDKTVIVSGLVEPQFRIPNKRPWNEVLSVEQLAGETVWFRRSVPGGAWTFKAESYGLIFPVSTFPGIDDVPACEQLEEQGYRVAAVDLADHAGVGQSTWGNASHQQYVEKTVEQLKDEWL